VPARNSGDPCISPRGQAGELACGLMHGSPEFRAGTGLDEKLCP